MKFVNKFILVILILSTYGCATNAYKAKNNVTLRPESNIGLAVVTLNTSGVPKGFHYRITSENNDKTFIIPEYGFSESMLPMLMSDFEDIKGKLIVLELPAGKYKFTEWFNITGSQYGTYEVQSKQDFPIYFEVLPNKACYVGEIYQTNKYSGISIVDSKLTIVDNAERDTKLFLEQYPNINKTNAVIKLAYKNE